MADGCWRSPLCRLSPAEASVSIYLVCSDDTQPQDLTRREKILLAEYQEVCKSHSGITDFRAKLLALLPIASGAGVGLLVTQGQGEASGTGSSRAGPHEHPRRAGPRLRGR